MQLEQRVEQAQVRGTQAARITDSVMRIVCLVCAILLVAVIVGVFLLLGLNSFKIFGEGTTVGGYLFGTNWNPTGCSGSCNPSFGAGGLILGSVITTLLAIIIATPLSFGMALFFTEICPRSLARLLQPLIEIFTGMPSVVIGLLGLVVLVPFLTRVIGPLEGKSQTAGYGWGAATLVLIIMIMPTVISISIDALRAVPTSVREASLALGSTRWQMMSRAIIPAATTGLATAVVLGIARAIGETIAVALVLSGSEIPKDLFSFSVLFQPNVNVTQQIANDFGEAFGAARDAYYTLAFVLLIIAFIFVCISRYLASRSVYK